MFSISVLVVYDDLLHTGASPKWPFKKLQSLTLGVSFVFSSRGNPLTELLHSNELFKFLKNSLTAWIIINMSNILNEKCYTWKKRWSGIIQTDHDLHDPSMTFLLEKWQKYSSWYSDSVEVYGREIQTLNFLTFAQLPSEHVDSFRKCCRQWQKLWDAAPPVESSEESLRWRGFQHDSTIWHLCSNPFRLV